MRTAKEKTRINLSTFDLIKGLGILVVVLMHMLPQYDLERVTALGFLRNFLEWFAPGAMPLFYIASGYSFKPKPAGKMLKKTASDFLKPFYLVMIAVGIFFPLCHYLSFRWLPGALHESTRYVLAFVLGVATSGKEFLGYTLYECSVVWFLLSLFVAYNVLNQILRLKSSYAQLAAVAVCIAAGFFLHKLDFIYFCIPQGLMAVGYCYMGVLLKRHNVFTQGTMPWWGYALMAVAAVVQLVWGEINIAHGVYKLGLFEYVAAGGAGVLFLAFGVQTSKLEWKVLEPIRAVGVYTYWIICIHSVEQICIPWYQWSNMLGEHQLRGFGGEFLIKVTIYTTVCFLLRKLSQRKYKKIRQRTASV